MNNDLRHLPPVRDDLFDDQPDGIDLSPAGIGLGVLLFVVAAILLLCSPAIVFAVWSWAL